MQERQNIDLPVYKKRLIDRKHELENMIKESHEDTNPVDIDQAQVGLLSRMEAMEEHAVAEEVEHLREQELLKVDSALERMQKGEYGLCVSCGEEIEEKRLELDPAVPLCYVCAS